jgi:TrmH family RNA methyltransferase
MIHLTSVKNSIVQKALKLRKESSFRQKLGLCVVFKDHLIQEISRHVPIETLFTLDPYQKIPAKETFLINQEIFEKIAGVSSSDQMIALCPIPPFIAPKKGRILVLDRLQDPGNVGTLIRSMEAFGFNSVFFLDEGVDPFNEKVIRSSMGAVFRIPMFQGDIEALKSLDILLIGADMGGQSVEHFTPPPNFALILGHEGQGLQKNLKPIIQTVKIPMMPPTESLNVAQAGAIFLYFLGRSRGL